MAVKNFNDSEKQKLIQIISQGSQVLGEVDDLRSGLRDTVKSIAEELELKPALINKAISIAHKGNYQNISDDSYITDQVAFWNELLSVIVTIIGSCILTFTSPTPTMHYVFPLYLIGSSTLCYASYRRRNIWKYSR